MTKQDTNMRKSIRASEILYLTLQYLATGNAQSSIATSYQISAAVVSRAINEAWNELKNRDFLIPNTVEEWKKVAKVFEEKRSVYNNSSTGYCMIIIF